MEVVASSEFSLLEGLSFVGNFLRIYRSRLRGRLYLMVPLTGLDGIRHHHRRRRHHYLHQGGGGGGHQCHHHRITLASSGQERYPDAPPSIAAAVLPCAIPEAVFLAQGVPTFDV